MKMAMESMEMDSGGTSPSRRRAGTETSVPRTWLRDGGGYVTFRGGRPISLGFSHLGEYIGGRAASEGPQGALPTWWRGQGWARATLWGGPLGTPPTSPLRLYIPPSPKTLTQSTIFHEEFRSRRHREDKFRGTEVSVPACRRDGELPSESISIDSIAIFIAVAVSHDEEGVVLPRG